MRVVLALLALVLGPAAGAAATTLLDYITFDGIDYIRFADEPGRPLDRGDLGAEFAVIECSFGEDTRACSYGVDAAAAFLPSRTRVYAVRGYPTNFRLAAVWKRRNDAAGTDLFFQAFDREARPLTDEVKLRSSTSIGIAGSVSYGPRMAGIDGGFALAGW